MEGRQLADFAGQSGQKEDHPQHDEQAESGQQQGDVDPGGHLPDLGVDEQEGIEQEEQRQGSHPDADGSPDVAEEPANRPGQNGDDSIAGAEVDGSEDDQVGQDGETGGRELPAEDDRDEGGPEDEHRQLEPADPLGPGEQWSDAPHPVHGCPDGEQDPEAPDGDADVLADREVIAESADHAQQEDDGQQR